MILTDLADLSKKCQKDKKKITEQRTSFPKGLINTNLTELYAYKWVMHFEGSTSGQFMNLWK